MQLKLVRSLWGIELPLDQALHRLKQEGYTAIEAASDREQLPDLLKQYGLEYVAMVFTGGSTIAEHVQSFRDQAKRAVRIGARQITVHSGSDAWAMSDCEQFFSEIVSIEKDLSIPVGHETHRGRVFFNPWVTRDLLLKFPAIKLCCDFSHWVCVAERLNWDDADGSILRLCAERALHVHTRIGYEEGPQVPDPSAPEYRRHLAAHLDWWGVIWRSQKQRNMAESTVTPEFGPPGYMHTLPHTNVPVASLWAVCNWTAAQVRERFSETLRDA